MCCDPDPFNLDLFTSSIEDRLSNPVDRKGEALSLIMELNEVHESLIMDDYPYDPEGATQAQIGVWCALVNDPFPEEKRKELLAQILGLCNPFI